ncbi:hypothetical protein D3C71_24980 [compost metagenome]
MRLDETGWAEVLRELQALGFAGTREQLVDVIDGQSSATDLRMLWQYWSWGAGAKNFVSSLVACARRRRGNVTVLSGVSDAYARGPRLLLSFPGVERGLQALDIQLKGDEKVYLAAKYDGDWRRTRTFDARCWAASAPEGGVH